MAKFLPVNKLKVEITHEEFHIISLALEYYAGRSGVTESEVERLLDEWQEATPG